jgi:hypothetical protein
MKKLLSLIVFVGVSTNAFAWDSNGHRIVATIAYQLLLNASDARAAHARGQLFGYLRMCPQGFQEAGLAATFPDEIKSGPLTRFPYDIPDDRFKPQHYVNVEIRSYPSLSHQWQPVGGQNPGVVYAIQHAQQVLKGTAAVGSLWQNHPEEALMFLLHCVGDVHQPLHVGDNDDIGGNNAYLAFPPDVSHPQKMHSFWDEVATKNFAHPTQADRTLVPYPGVSKAENIENVARDLMEAYKPTPAEIAVGDPEKWAAESYGLSVKNAYDVDMSNTTPHLDSHGHRDGTTYKPHSQYKENWKTIGLKRLDLAGYRLAELLKGTLES